MRAGSIALLLIPLTLVSCTNIPKSFHNQAATGAEIVQAIQCELASVYQDPTAADIISAWFVRVRLSLSGTNSVGLNSSLIPATAPPTQKLTAQTATLGATNTNVRTAVVQYDAALQDYAPFSDTGAPLAATCPAPGTKAASAGLGLSQWMKGVLAPIGRTVGTLSELSYTVNFTVTRNFSGGLSFKTSLFEIKADNKPQSSNNDTNVLTVTFLRLKSATVLGVGRGTEIPDEITDEFDRIFDEAQKEPFIKLVPGDTLVVQ